uniref:Uncharacterized protein n=1 Tax=Oryza glumipatula TaxID=40148 RepID=A0A0D9Z6B6_9ORYZ
MAALGPKPWILKGTIGKSNLRWTGDCLFPEFDIEGNRLSCTNHIIKRLLKEAAAAATAVDPEGGGYDLQWRRLLPKVVAATCCGNGGGGDSRRQQIHQSRPQATTVTGGGGNCCGLRVRSMEEFMGEEFMGMFLLVHTDNSELHRNKQHYAINISHKHSDATIYSIGIKSMLRGLRLAITTIAKESQKISNGSGDTKPTTSREIPGNIMSTIGSY